MEIENGSGVVTTVRPAFFSCIDRIYEDDKREREHHDDRCLGGVFGL